MTEFKVSLRSVISRLSASDGISYVLGRFFVVRKLYSLWRHLYASIILQAKDAAPSTNQTLFPNLNVLSAIAELRMHSLAFGFNLPTSVVHELREFAHEAILVIGGGPSGFEFYYDDIHKRLAHEGTRVPIAFVKHPANSEILQCVAEDPKLLAVVEAFLGYMPKKRQIRLYFSCVTDMPNPERRQLNQTIDFHFDVQALNFCYVSFYLTDCDVNHGAHVAVRGSHRLKPMRFLLGSARRSDEDIRSFYGEHAIHSIEGPAGPGFIEDTSCFHKALIPTSGERLMLQVRYS